MTDGLNGIMAQLERQKTGIEKALAALRGIEGIAVPDAVPVAKKRGRPPKAASEGNGDPWPRKSRVTEAGREKLRLAMKRRWAVKRAAGKKRAGRPKKAV